MNEHRAIGRRKFLRQLSFLATFGVMARNASLAGPQETVVKAIENAHAALWKSRVDRHGIILDYVGEIPTPEDCALGKPNVIGWWSPIENGPFFTGLYLLAACERARRNGDPADKEKARRLAAGLMKCASVSDVPGFIARGVGTDGKCHYPLGSDDQTHPWFFGLHAYFTSGIPTVEERQKIAAKMRTVAEVLESTGWQCPADGAFKGKYRGGYRGHLFRDAVRFLFLLRAMYDVTKDRAWLDRYQRALTQRPIGSQLTRAEICAAGYGPDREAIRNLDGHQMWIYVGCQGSLVKLIALETDETVRTQYRAGLSANAKGARTVMGAFASFNNDDKQVFGHANWREGYPDWKPQKTQEDAAAVARSGDAVKLGTRKSYETKFMRNPLAAAAIVALAGDKGDREGIERVIRHYDYTRIYMSEFFLAEVAYYAMAAGR